MVCREGKKYSKLIKNPVKFLSQLITVQNWHNVENSIKPIEHNFSVYCMRFAYLQLSFYHHRII